MIEAILTDAFWSALAALGFAILFNVPRKALPYCIAAGAAGHAVRTFFTLRFNMSIEAATLISASTVGFMARYFAYRLKMPSLIFAISGSIPLVPGAFAYGTMIALLRLAASMPETASEQLTLMAINGVKTALILGAIAAGNVMPALLFDHRKPVV